MEAAGDDARKKRASAQVEHKGEEEKSKKVRVDANSQRKQQPAIPHRQRTSRQSHNAEPLKKENSQSTAPVGAACSFVHATDGKRSSISSSRVWDMESAIFYLTQPDGTSKEYLMEDEATSPWITFRAGHAGDASTIAQWYQDSLQAPTETPELDIAQEQPQPLTESDDDPTSSMLEVWLADGLGDEDTPPVVHALLAHIVQEKEDKITSALAAVALLVMTWTEGERHLRVEWMHIDSNIDSSVAAVLEQRIWLRIVTLSHMTACQAVSFDKSLAVARRSGAVNGKPSPSAE